MSKRINRDGLIIGYNYNIYANTIVLDAITGLSDEVLQRKSGVSHDSVFEMLRHTLGDPAEVAGEREITDSPAELAPQSLVPAGWWQGARVLGDAGQAPERAWSLVSCVVTPGFDLADFELGRREALLAAFPQHRGLVLAFT